MEQRSRAPCRTARASSFGAALPSRVCSHSGPKISAPARLQMTPEKGHRPPPHAAEESAGPRRNGHPSTLSCIYILACRDQEYIVRDGKVEIVDSNTGRVRPGTRWQHSLHQVPPLAQEILNYVPLPPPERPRGMETGFAMYRCAMAAAGGGLVAREGERHLQTREWCGDQRLPHPENPTCSPGLRQEAELSYR